MGISSTKTLKYQKQFYVAFIHKIKICFKFCRLQLQLLIEIS